MRNQPVKSIQIIICCNNTQARDYTLALHPFLFFEDTVWHVQLVGWKLRTSICLRGDCNFASRIEVKSQWKSKGSQVGGCAPPKMRNRLRLKRECGFMREKDMEKR
jgi:hypothetical protein